MAISIHAPREGGDPALHGMRCVPSNFNPRPPRGGRQRDVAGRERAYAAFQSTPPARGATSRSSAPCKYILISIHAPREGGDHGQHHQQRLRLISIHAPREGGDVIDFQQALSNDDFNPRPPRGGRLGDGLDRGQGRDISIHAPREGGDKAPLNVLFQSHLFQSTPPARGATRSPVPAVPLPPYFNPRPPRGGRQVKLGISIDTIVFQSTPPARGATNLQNPPQVDL